LKHKKTLSNWLTNRFLLIIRNEENFAEKRTFSFTYAKLIVFSITFLIITFGISFYLIHSINWLNPRDSQIKTDKKLVLLSATVDSLSVEVERKDSFILNFKRMLMGGNDNIKRDTTRGHSNNIKGKAIDIDYVAPSDLELRKEIENEENEPKVLKSSLGKRPENLFFLPVEGVVEQKFNPQNGNFGIVIGTKPDQPVKALADGNVIISNWTEQSGFIIGIQHANGYISIYMNNSKVFKKAGSLVKAGDVISLLETSSGKGGHLHLELWHNGNAVNPQEYVNIK
jgi:murein DD-endopeptidase MepM/ murein hydrolase activator NlpD